MLPDINQSINRINKVESNNINIFAQLPFDIRTVFVSLRQRYALIIKLILISCMIGVVAALMFGQRTYRSETVLLYKPKSSITGEERDTPSVNTQMNMVKLNGNLVDVRRSLKLDSTLEMLGSNIDVNIRRDTNLMTLSSTWNDAKTARDIANILTDIFLRKQKEIRELEIRQLMSDVQYRITEASEKLVNVEGELEAFTMENKVVDLGKQAQWLLEELAQIHILIDEAIIEKTTIEMQSKSVDKIINDLKVKIEQESNNGVQTESKENLDLKMRRLRESIIDDRSQRVQAAELAKQEADFERAKTLVDRDLIPRVEFTKIEENYERVKALAVDTNQIKKWKDEMEIIDNTILPEEGKESISGRLLQEVMLKAFDVELHAVALDEKVQHLNNAAEKVQNKLNLIPKLQRRLTEFKRILSGHEATKQELENILRKAKQTSELELSDYIIISPASLPIYPESSTRRIIAIILSAIIGFVGIITIIIKEIFQPLVRSSSELTQKTGMPVLASLPLIDEPGTNAVINNYNFDEECRFLLHSIEPELPYRGARILITGSEGEEGVSTLTNHLANLYVRQNKKVLIIENLTRNKIIPASNKSEINLDLPLDRNILDFNTEKLKFIKSGDIARISLGEEKMNPDYISSREWINYLKDLSSNYDVIILESPPANNFAEAHILAKLCHTTIFVARSQMTSISRLNNLADSFIQNGISSVGIVLNGIPSRFRFAA
jgi:polysaccharide biosynthesis transport protein